MVACDEMMPDTGWPAHAAKLGVMSRVLAALLRSAPVVTSAAILAATVTPAEASTPPAVVEPITQPDTRFLGVSPDGHLVAALEEGDDPLVCALDVTTLDEVACDELPAVRLDDRSVRWSPDSTAFAFTEPSFVYLTDGDLWVFDIKGGGVRDLTDDGYSGPLTDADDSIAIDVLPAWSPDSSTIAFSRSSIADGASGTVIAPSRRAGGRRPRSPTSPTSRARCTSGWCGRRLTPSSTHEASDDPANGVYRLGTADGSTEQLMGVDPELGPPVIQDVTPDGATGLIL